ncbi:MAG: 4Fe-4S dicluster domain-containing protein, partial [Planctomycetes bacterium]|nr:4Fe-4S dicluster domain-containing protein [Planctomycetota bacterium]
EDLEDRIPDSFEALCTTCGYCLPCPQDVPIPKLMDAFNLSILDGETENVLRRMKGHWGIDPDAADRCTACGECEVRCTQNLPIRERIAAIREIARARETQG